MTSPLRTKTAFILSTICGLLISTVLAANAAFPTAAIMSTRDYMTFADLKDSLGNALRAPQIVQDLPLLETSKVPTNEPVGSPATNNGAAIYVGDYTQAMLGLRTDLQIDVLKERYADAGQYGFCLWWRGDFQLKHQQSFSIQTGVQ